MVSTSTKRVVLLETPGLNQGVDLEVQEVLLVIQVGLDHPAILTDVDLTTRNLEAEVRVIPENIACLILYAALTHLRGGGIFLICYGLMYSKIARWVQHLPCWIDLTPNH